MIGSVRTAAIIIMRILILLRGLKNEKINKMKVNPAKIIRK